jgi:hypothetical protein
MQVVMGEVASTAIGRAVTIVIVEDETAFHRLDSVSLGRIGSVFESDSAFPGNVIELWD